MADCRLKALLTSSQEDSLNQISLLEARLYMGNTLLRDCDQMSMAHSLELRVPLVDQVLATYLLGVPSSVKGFGRMPKLWLRNTYGSLLPAEVFARNKMGFTLPLSLWLKGALSSEVEHTLKGDSTLWNSEAVWTIWRGFQQGRIHWRLPWALYVLKRWVSTNIDGEGQGENEMEHLPTRTDISLP